MLYALLVVLSVGDYLITQYGLSIGKIELNPLIAGRDAAQMAIIKLYSIAISGVALCFLPREYAGKCCVVLIFLAAVSTYVLLYNWIVLLH